MNNVIPPGGGRAWFIWSLSALAFGYAFFQRVAPSVMVSDLMAEFAIGGAVLGTLSALYFYPYVLLQIPLGALLDRMGARILLSSALMFAAIGSILFASAESLHMAYAGRIMIGVGSAVGFLGSLALAGKWFPPERFAFLAGLAMFFGMISGMLAQAPLSIYVETFGWRASMWSLGIFGACLSLTVFVFVRNSPQSGDKTHEKPVESWGSIWKGLGKAAKSFAVWKIAIVAAAMSGPMLTIGGLWGTPYLMSAYNLERPQAAFLISLLLLGWAFGAPFAGWLSNLIKQQKILLVCGSAILTIALGIMTIIPTPPLWLTVILLIIIGTSGAAMAVTFALAREIAPAEISGSVAGIVNSMTVASGALLQPLVGLILDTLWDGTIIEGSRVYDQANYQNAFLLVFATAALGFMVSLLLPEKKIG